MSEEDFKELEGEAREGAVVAVICILSFLSFLSGAFAGWISRGLWG